jgi:hypothetical protein
MARGATPAMTVSGAAAETTKKAMSAVPREPERRVAVAGGVRSPEVVTDMGKPFERRTGRESGRGGNPGMRDRRGLI